MDTTNEMTTLSECMKKVQADGFKENFLMKENKLYAPGIKKFYAPDDLRITSFYRFEGNSDPADNSILYAIETYDGIKGILIDAYGSYADSKTSEYIKRVEEIEKKKHVDSK